MFNVPPLMFTKSLPFKPLFLLIISIIPLSIVKVSFDWMPLAYNAFTLSDPVPLITKSDLENMAALGSSTPVDKL